MSGVAEVRASRAFVRPDHVDPGETFPALGRARTLPLEPAPAHTEYDHRVCTLRDLAEHPGLSPSLVRPGCQLGGACAWR